MNWEQGRTTIDQLIRDGHLERVQPSDDHVAGLMTAARAHLSSARTLQTTDPAGAYGLLYDAARKALAAILANQGLRATSRGGHLVLHEAASAQLVPPLSSIVRPFNRMRARRNDVEYPDPDDPTVTTEDVIADISKAKDIVDMAEKAIPRMDLF